VNTLRNEALAAVSTRLTLGLDADFVLGGGIQTLQLPAGDPSCNLLSPLNYRATCCLP
jgi:hypothetical protein